MVQQSRDEESHEINVRLTLSGKKMENTVIEIQGDVTNSIAPSISVSTGFGDGGGQRAFDSSALLNFGQALDALKAGKLVARQGWNGKGTFLYFVKGSTFTVNRAPLLGIYPEGTEITYCPHIDMKTADGSCVPWLASQTDVLAEDWLVVDMPSSIKTLH